MDSSCRSYPRAGYQTSYLSINNEFLFEWIGLHPLHLPNCSTNFTFKDGTRSKIQGGKPTFQGDQLFKNIFYFAWGGGPISHTSPQHHHRAPVSIYSYFRFYFHFLVKSWNFKHKMTFKVAIRIFTDPENKV